MTDISGNLSFSLHELGKEKANEVTPTTGKGDGLS